MKLEIGKMYRVSLTERGYDAKACVYFFEPGRRPMDTGLWCPGMQYILPLKNISHDRGWDIYMILTDFGTFIEMWVDSRKEPYVLKAVLEKVDLD